MNLMGNIIWLIFGGLIIALEYCIAGLIFTIIIIGIPWGLQCFKLAILALYPFGSNVVSSPQATGCLNTLMNIIWIFIGGIWICLSHFFFGILLCITIVGIPWGRQHFKLATLSLNPFGLKVV